MRGKMIYSYISAAVLTLMMLTTQGEALLLGAYGHPLAKEDLSWQPVEYETSFARAHMEMPGLPYASWTGNTCWIQSEEKSVVYSFSMPTIPSYTPPLDFKLFYKEIRAVEPEKFDVYSIEHPGRGAQYAVEIHEFDAARSRIIGIRRIYSSKNNLYTVAVHGDNLSHATAFFDSLFISH